MADGNGDRGAGRPGRDFDNRLARAQRASEKAKPSGRPKSGLGIAFRLSTELVAAVAVGGGMGWLLDAWAGTKPWFFLALLGLGIAAGFLNVFRTAREMNAASAAGEPPRRDEGG